MNNLIDNFNNGAYFYKVYDAASGRLIFSKGFNSFFGEYRTTGNAIKGFKRTYQKSAIIPYPKSKIRFVIEKRHKRNGLTELFSSDIDPSDIYIIRETVKDNSVNVYKSHFSGNPHAKVDIAILGNGYTLNEQKKFEKDLMHFTVLFLRTEPYASLKDKFNIYGVFMPSEDSGIDEPGAGIYKYTVLSTTFYSLGSERYILTDDNNAVHDIAAQVPYDAIYIMCNSARYGGGGIYNFYCTFVSDNQFSDYIFLHEFGHSFSGLDDEYYTSDVAYDDFYPEAGEPVEPNITRLLDKNNFKWKVVISTGI